MRPVEFGGCFGWLHPASGSRGVVLCNSFGYEQLSVHRVWRGLADQFAAAGLPALRFDWHGSGDSIGDYTDPERVRTWLESVRGAVARLRAETGVSEVALVGLRLGATLAALLAEESGDVESLALLAPVVSGKAYVREMRALSAFARSAAPAAAADDGELEAAGFVMSASTLAELREIDLVATVRRAPARRVLLMHRPDAPTNPRLAAHLGQLGAEIQEAPIEGYSGFVCDSEFSQPPRAAFDLLVEWVGQGARKQEIPFDPPCPKPVRMRIAGAVEEPVELAGRARLIATACTPTVPPTGGTGENDRPALIFLNTGWYMRAGANRMAVTMARRCAARGFTSLRLDLAGVGDSDAAPENDSVVYNVKSCIDVSTAIDWLAARGHRRVVLFGICSGAYLSFQAAYRDPRIVGQILVNADRFEWTERDTVKMSQRTVGRGARQLIGLGLRAIFNLGKLRRILSGDPVALGLARAASERSVQALRRRLGATADTAAARRLRELLNRHVKTLLVFSTSDAGLAECLHQFGPEFELVGKSENLQLETIDDASHTLAERRSRAALTLLLDKFLEPWAAVPAPAVRAA
jgi:pimeloyl-ACP methyl ester carboxylesterase